MSYPNGTLTAAEHAALAADTSANAVSAAARGTSPETHTIALALEGLTHAVLALVQTVEDLPDRTDR